MRNFKRFLSLVVAALLVMSAMSASAVKFTDVDASDAALTDAVELLVSLGVTKGTTETTFGTTENVTRQQMAAFAYRMMKAGKSVEGGANSTKFTDLTDPTYNFMISWASTNGIIKGRTATEFDPKGGIVLQDAYTMLVRALGWDDGTYTYPISYIDKAEELGLDKSLPSTLGYKDTLTRGDLAIILANMFYADTAETVIKYVTSTANGATTITPVEENITLAKKVFEVEKTALKVVATPNFGFGTDALDAEDGELIKFSKDIVDVKEYDMQPSIDTIRFEELGLEGKADDYFLSDIVMFVKYNDRTDKYDIFGAVAQGTKKTVSFDKIKFELASGDKYYDAEEEYKEISGKLDIDGTTAYLFGDKYAFNNGDEGLYNSKFITMVKADGYDFEEGKLFTEYAVVEGLTYDAGLVGTYNDTNDVWAYDGYLSQLYFGGLGEVDCFDCNGDGKYEYLFVKNYAVGEIETKKDTTLKFAVSTAMDDQIETSMAMVEGVEAADEDIVLAYVNTPANYVKVIEVLAPKTVEIAEIGTEKDITTIKFNDEKVVSNENLAATTANSIAGGLYTDFTKVAFNTDYEAYYTAAGKLVALDKLTAGFDLNEDWVIVLDEKVKTFTEKVDNKVVESKYISVYNDGEVKLLKVGSDDAGKDLLYKFSTAKANKKGIYEITGYAFSDSKGTSLDKLTNAAAEDYVVLSADAEFAKGTGSRYTIDGTNELNIRDYTKIIIESVDPEDKDSKVYTVFGAENLPDIKKGTTLKNVTAVVTDNIKSSRENLALFFGTYDGVLKAATGEVANVQIVKGISATSTEEEIINKYSVIGLDGRGATYSGTEIDGKVYAKAGDLVALTTEDLIDELVGAHGNIFTAGAVYDVDKDFESYKDAGAIGYKEILGYDEGIVEIGDGNTYYVTKDTAIVLVDKATYTGEALDVADAEKIFDIDEYDTDDLINGKLNAVFFVEETEKDSKEFDILNVILVVEKLAK